jgi:hypothetical protein
MVLFGLFPTKYVLALTHVATIRGEKRRNCEMKEEDTFEELPFLKR